MVALVQQFATQPESAHYDANRNVARIDTEDKQVAFDSDDPTSACYAQFSPGGSGGTAHLPMKAGPGLNQTGHD